MSAAKLRAVIYARVSSTKQRDAHTIESQLRALPQVVAANGWQLVRPADTYVDDGRTAKAGNLDKREGFQRLMADALAGEFDVVVVVSVDRITRSEDAGERGLIAGMFQRAGVRVATPSGEHDLQTLAGEITFSLDGILGAYENKERRKRILRGRARAIENGGKPSGRTPYGLTYDRTSKSWGIDETEAAIVKELFQRVADGDSCEQLARDLTARAVPRRGGGTRWTREQVWSLVRSATYVGRWLADTKQQRVVAVPAIVTEAQQQAAVDAMARRGARVPKRAPGRVTYLLQGLAVCGVCGGQMVCYSGSATPDARWYHPPQYLCSFRHRPRGGTKCSAPRVRVDDVDARLWSALRNAIEHPGALERALDLRKQQAGKGASSWESDLKEWRRRLRRLDDHEDTVTAQHRRGKLSARAYDKELTAIAKERDLLEQQVKTAERAMASEAARAGRTQAAETLLAELRAKLDKADKATQRRLVAALFEPGAVSIGPDGVRGTVRLRFTDGGGLVQPALGSACRTEQGLHLVELTLVA